MAIESSAKPASVAITEDRRLLGLSYLNNAMTHSKTLLPLVEHMLAACGLDLSGIDLIAVSNGPGSFTGIRIGCSIAKGLSWASQTPCCAVSTLEAMACQCLDFEGYLICAAMDARRSQVYNALFETQQGVLKRICEDRAVSLEQLDNDIKNTEKSILLIGDGAELCYNQMRERKMHCDGREVKLAHDHIRYQNAWGVALAAMGKDPSEYGEPDPRYLRPSQAERERLEKGEA